MKLYLSSYKLGNNKEELKRWIEEHGNKIVLIPNSRDVYEESERKSIGINKDIEELKSLGFEVTTISLKEFFGQYDRLKKDLEQYPAFFAIGGNSFALRKAMQLSGFDRFLKEISSNSDYLYGGYSAGICVLAPNLHGLEIVDEPCNPYNEDEILYDGINLLDYLPTPHYKSEHPESKLMDDVIEYCKKNNVKYKTLRDGEVIIENIGREQMRNELER